MIIYGLAGMAIGLMTAAPVGPVNVMCAHRAFHFGFWAGLTAGLGAMVADLIFAAVAAFGVTAIQVFIQQNEGPVQVVGGVLLIIFGWKILTSSPIPADDPAATHSTRKLAAFLAAFAMTITNPGAVFGFIAIFTMLGDWAPRSGDYQATAMLLLGVMIGNLAWWVLISGFVGHLRERLADTWLIRFNKIAGYTLVLFGAVLLLRLAVVWLV